MWRLFCNRLSRRERCPTCPSREVQPHRRYRWSLPCGWGWPVTMPSRFTTQKRSKYLLRWDLKSCLSVPLKINLYRMRLTSYISEEDFQKSTQHNLPQTIPCLPIFAELLLVACSCMLSAAGIYTWGRHVSTPMECIIHW